MFILLPPLDADQYFLMQARPLNEAGPGSVEFYGTRDYLDHHSHQVGAIRNDPSKIFAKIVPGHSELRIEQVDIGFTMLVSIDLAGKSASHLRILSLV